MLVRRTWIVALSTMALLAAYVSPVSAVYSDGQMACYGGWEETTFSVMYFDGELPGCVDGIGPRLDVPTADGTLVSGPWLYWSP